jgi:hypothetical protein
MRTTFLTATVHSWITPFLVSLITLGLCAAIATRSTAAVIPNALVVFAVSVVGFHAVAALTYRRKRLWNALDYTMELVTIVTLLAALAGIQEASRLQVLDNEFAKRKAEQAMFLYALKGVITNDCHPKESRMGIWTPSPEPYEGACDRIEHFLPQIEFSFGSETGVENMTSDTSWPQNILINEDAAVGSWKGVYIQAHKLIEGSRRTSATMSAANANASEVTKVLAVSGRLLYWQYLLALVLGLRFARRTAGLLQGRPENASGPPMFLLLQALRRSSVRAGRYGSAIRQRLKSR